MFLLLATLSLRMCVSLPPSVNSLPPSVASNDEEQHDDVDSDMPRLCHSDSDDDDDDDDVDDDVHMPQALSHMVVMMMMSLAGVM